jgi:hypothetical protein
MKQNRPRRPKHTNFLWLLQVLKKIGNILPANASLIVKN